VEIVITGAGADYGMGGESGMGGDAMSGL